MKNFTLPPIQQLFADADRGSIQQGRAGHRRDGALRLLPPQGPSRTPAASVQSLAPRASLGQLSSVHGDSTRRLTALQQLPQTSPARHPDAQAHQAPARQRVAAVDPTSAAGHDSDEDYWDIPVPPHIEPYVSVFSMHSTESPMPTGSQVAQRSVQARQAMRPGAPVRTHPFAWQRFSVRPRKGPEHLIRQPDWEKLLAKLPKKNKELIQAAEVSLRAAFPEPSDRPGRLMKALIQFSYFIQHRSLDEFVRTEGKQSPRAKARDFLQSPDVLAFREREATQSGWRRDINPALQYLSASLSNSSEFFRVRDNRPNTGLMTIDEAGIVHDADPDQARDDAFA